MITQNDIDTMMKDIEDADGKVEFIPDNQGEEEAQPMSLFELFFWFWFVK